MKKLAISFVAVLVGSALGGYFGTYFAHRASPERETYLLHESLNSRAKIYLRFLRAQDSAAPEEMMLLRRNALATLRLYVHEEAELQSRGLKWAPFDPELYASARDYLARTPKE